MKSVNIMKSVKLFLSNLAIVALVLVLSNCGGGEDDPPPKTVQQIAADKLVGNWKITGVKSDDASGTLADRADDVTDALKAATFGVTKNADNMGGGVSVSGLNLPDRAQQLALLSSVTTWSFSSDAATEINFGATKITIPASFKTDDNNVSTLVIKFEVSGGEKAPSLNSSARTFGVTGNWELTITKQ